MPRVEFVHKMKFKNPCIESHDADSANGVGFENREPFIEIGLFVMLSAGPQVLGTQLGFRV